MRTRLHYDLRRYILSRGYVLVLYSLDRVQTSMFLQPRTQKLKLFWQGLRMILSSTELSFVGSD